MKKYCFYLTLAGLIAPCTHSTQKPLSLTKQQLFIDAIGRGFVFTGQKLKDNKKIVFIATGITSAIGISMYLNSDKIENSYKPKALFEKNTSFNPFASHFIERVVQNICDFALILCGKETDSHKKIKNITDASKINLTNIIAIKKRLFPDIDNVNDQKIDDALNKIDQLNQDSALKDELQKKNQAFETQILEQQEKIKDLTKSINNLKNLHEETIKKTEQEHIQLVNLKVEEIKKIKEDLNILEKTKDEKIQSLQSENKKIIELGITKSKEYSEKIKELEKNLKEAQETLKKLQTEHTTLQNKINTKNDNTVEQTIE